MLLRFNKAMRSHLALPCLVIVALATSLAALLASNMDAYPVLVLVAAVFGLLGWSEAAKSPLSRSIAAAAFGLPFIVFWLKSTEQAVTSWQFAAATLFALFYPIVIRGKGSFSLFVAFGCGWVIALLSSSKGGPDPMRELLIQWFSFDAGQADLWVLIIRKTIHFGFYGFTALTAFYAALPKRRVHLALGYVASLAIFDEVRQASFSTRTGSIFDVALDLAGAAFFIVIATRISGHRQKKVHNG